MENDFESKIKEIGGMLGIENIPDNIGDIISAFVSNSGNENNEEDHAAPQEEATVQNNEGQGFDTSQLLGLLQGFSGGKKEPEVKEEDDDLFGSINPQDMLKWVGKFQAAGNVSKHDDRAKLLRALKPFLNEKKQKKVGTCIRMLSLSSMIK